MLYDQILTPPDCRLAGASKFYDQLLDYVQTKYSDSPPETRAIIFALAYAKGSHTKKSGINQNCVLDPQGRPDRKKNDDVIATLIGAASTKGNFEALSRESAEVFEKLRSETMADATNRFATSVSTAVQDSVEAAVTHSIELGIAPLIKPAPRSVRSRILHFLLDGLHHAGLVFLAGLYFLLIGYSLNLVVPSVLQALRHGVEEAFKPIVPSPPAH